MKDMKRKETADPNLGDIFNSNYVWGLILN